LQDTGSVQLFFDHPSVPASLVVQVDDRDGRSGDPRYSIYLEDGYAGPQVRFFLVLSGRAMVPETYPDGEPSGKPDGCWAGLYVILDKGTSVACYKAQLGTHAGYTRPENRTATQVVSGALGGSPSGRDAQIQTFPDAGYAVSAGKRTYFTLPSIGTPHIPAAYRSSIETDLSAGHHGFVPGRLDMEIDYGSLAPAERLDSVAPEPAKAGTKSWVELDADMISARGSIVDSVLEEKAQRDTFLYGAFVGVAATMLPILGEKLVKLWWRPPHVAGEGTTSPVRDPFTRTPPEKFQPGTKLLRQRLQRAHARRAPIGPDAEEGEN
jgi:hypothetical protein